MFQPKYRLPKEIPMELTEIATVLVLSGVTNTEDLKHFAYHPHYVLDGVGDIPLIPTS